RNRIDSGIVLITHDMGVVADMADRIVVMRRGRIVEGGEARAIFSNPQHPYTRQLLAAVPTLRAHRTIETTVHERDHGGETPMGEPVMVAENMVIEYPKRGRTPAFRAVDGVSLTINAGEVVGLVGESGSGKTTIGRAVVGLLPVTEGKLEIAGF